MNPMINATETLPLTSPHSLHLQSPFLHSRKLCFLNYRNNFRNRTLALESKSRQWRTIRACANDQPTSASMSEINMVKSSDGVYTAKPPKVVVLWDLDNKPPRGPPYSAAMALKRVAEKFGDVVDMSAYANHHAFNHLPQWVVEERRNRRHVDILERKGLVNPLDPYICSVCGRKYKTNLDLKKHFRQLHERERQKKLNRMRSLKGKKRQKFKERFIDGNVKYQEAARSLLTPKVGYGLAAELRRAGVFVKTVQDKPQAADWALKRQMQHSMSRGIDWLFLISDDSDFSEMLRRAREANLGTVVIGDWKGALGRQADVWVPWAGVENGEVSEKDLEPRRSRRRSEIVNGGPMSITHFDGEMGGEVNLDSVMDELARTRSEFNNSRISAFSEGEEEDEDWMRGRVRRESDARFRVDQLLDEEEEDDNDDDDFCLDSEDE